MGTAGRTPEDAVAQNDAKLNRQLNRLSPTIVQSLTEEQKRAVGMALGDSIRVYPVNIRLSTPLLGGAFFAAMVSGKEQRSKERLAFERKAHPLFTFGNIQFLLIFAIITITGMVIIGSFTSLIFTEVLF